MTRSLFKKVGIASLIMMASVFLSRVVGLFREMVIAHIGGAGAAVDAYQVAFVIPDILNHVVASGFMSVTFIPIFSRYLADNREDDGWMVFSIILNCFGCFLVVLIIVALALTPQLIALIAPGLKNPDTIANAVRMTRIILPAQIFFFVGGLLMAVQFSKERFFIPALAPLLYNLGIISGGLMLGPWIGMEGFAWGVLIGAFSGNLFIQLFGVRQTGLKYFFNFDLSHPALKQYVFLTLPLMLGLTMTFSTEFFFRLFGSYLPQGSIAVLNYGLRIMLILVGLFGQAVGTASYPFLARLVAENKLDEMNRLLNNTLRFLAMVIPFSVLLMVLRSEVVRIIFQRGKFDAAATALTAEVLIYLMIGTFAFAAYTVVVRGYFASQNTLFPALYGTIVVIVSVPLYLLGMNLLGVRGVALAVSLSGILQVTVLYALWNKRSNNIEGRGVYAFYGKIMCFAAVLGISLEVFKSKALFWIDPSTMHGSLMVCLLTGMMFLGILLVTGYGLKIKEVTELVNRVVKKGY
ncbi:MAG: murein biosynthesis integral membrane protein MurJ [Desulfobacterales bacterium]|jgi:putative peptidoglycan lipid II flippase